jgi:hypothetical protein
MLLLPLQVQQRLTKTKRSKSIIGTIFVSFATLFLRLPLPLLDGEVVQPPHSPRAGVTEVSRELDTAEGLIV